MTHPMHADVKFPLKISEVNRSGIMMHTWNFKLCFEKIDALVLNSVLKQTVTPCLRL